MKGFSVLEVMIVIALLTVVMGTIFSVASSVQRTADMQQARATAHDEVRRAIQTIARDLRLAARSSVSALPAAQIKYRVAVDLDGNGSALDVHGGIELSPERVIMRDRDDVNHDGARHEQLILVDGDAVRVLANGLAPDEDLDGDGLLDEGEDTNGNGRLDHGIWFGSSGIGVEAVIETQVAYRPRRIVGASLSELVVPRN
ncbi:MAG TPA: prepilin-type N-terminal cleavage/methylation domain-containing protein [Candidatus Hydrogenedentes bacterium]|nr:prepilin-type N-terminal cleavage/methylation domain-containing protein [Candidatus Hydrogenedentota bacterium]